MTGNHHRSKHIGGTLHRDLSGNSGQSWCWLVLENPRQGPSAYRVHAVDTCMDAGHTLNSQDLKGAHRHRGMCGESWQSKPHQLIRSTRAILLRLTLLLLTSLACHQNKHLHWRQSGEQSVPGRGSWATLSAKSQ